MRVTMSSHQVDRGKLVLKTAFVSGLISHGVMMFNKISMHDDLGIWMSSCGVSSGRWVGRIYDSWMRALFGAKVSAPLWGGLWSIFFVAISAWLLLDMFDINRKLTTIFITTLMVSFPSVVNTFMYMNSAESFLGAFMLMTIAAWLTAKYKKGWLIAAPLIGISLGIYQAYLGWYLSALLLLGIKIVMSDIVEFRKLATHGFLGGGFGVAFYTIALKLASWITGISVSSYQGLNEMQQLDLLYRIKSIKKCYMNFVYLLTQNWYGMASTRFVRYLYAVLDVCLIVSFIMYIYVNRAKTFRAKILATISFALLPVAISVLYLMTTEQTSVALLTWYPMVMALIVIPVLVEWWKNETANNPNGDSTISYGVYRTVKTVAYGALAIVILYYVYLANGTYLRLTFLQEQISAYMTTMVTSIKMTDGYRDEYPVLWVGAGRIEDGSVNNDQQWKAFAIGYSQDTMGQMINNYAWRGFLEHHIGYKPNEITLDDISSEVKNQINGMPCYPDDGSIQVIDEVVVVKMGEIKENDE